MDPIKPAGKPGAVPLPVSDVEAPNAPLPVSPAPPAAPEVMELGTLAPAPATEHPIPLTLQPVPQDPDAVREWTQDCAKSLLYISPSIVHLEQFFFDRFLGQGFLPAGPEAAAVYGSLPALPGEGEPLPAFQVAFPPQEPGEGNEAYGRWLASVAQACARAEHPELRSLAGALAQGPHLVNATDAEARTVLRGLVARAHALSLYALVLQLRRSAEELRDAEQQFDDDARERDWIAALWETYRETQEKLSAAYSGMRAGHYRGFRDLHSQLIMTAETLTKLSR